MTFEPDPPPLPRETPVVSVVIVNWNTRNLLRDCLRSIIDETSVLHEIIVVDNASYDNSAEMVSEEFPDVILIENGKNLGFGVANNIGMKVSRGQYVLLLNSDTIVLDGAIDRMLDWIGQHPDVGCAGCQILESPTKIQRTCFADPGPLNHFIMEFGLTRFAAWFPVVDRPWYTTWDRKSERDVDVVSGMFMLVPRPVLEKVGLFDDAFFIYSEEADWCLRIRQAGWRCVFTPEAQIIHLDGGSKSTEQIRSPMHVELQRSKLIYIRKHHGRTGYAMAKAVFLCSAALRWLVFGALHIVQRDGNTRARIRLDTASLKYHITGRKPVS